MSKKINLIYKCLINVGVNYIYRKNLSARSVSQTNRCID